MIVYVPRCAKAIRKTFFNVRVCNSWNLLLDITHLTDCAARRRGCRGGQLHAKLNLKPGSYTLRFLTSLLIGGTP